MKILVAYKLKLLIETKSIYKSKTIYTDQEEEFHSKNIENFYTTNVIHRKLIGSCAIKTLILLTIIKIF